LCAQQFPGEEEVLMPPLSNLEVMGEPYLTRLEGHIVLIVPLRVNVNIKSKTMDELTSTRKDVLLSAIKDLHAESEQEVSELAQCIMWLDSLLFLLPSRNRKHIIITHNYPPDVAQPARISLVSLPIER